MASEPKSIPTQAPLPSGRIADGLRAAITDPNARPGALIRLRASGGVRGESYDLEYQIDATGRESGHLTDELKNRHVSQQAIAERPADPARFVALARAIDLDALTQVDMAPARFPPDSVVGRLELSDGRRTETFLFLADEQQASRARRLAPDALRKAVDAIFRAAAQYLGADEVRP